MKISQLINRLIKIREKHGDLPVHAYSELHNHQPIVNTAAYNPTDDRAKPTQCQLICTYT
jgi:hypothetical protein